MAAAVNYNEWIVRTLLPFLGERALEVGCGIGNMTALLLDHTAFIAALDPSREALALLRERFHGAPNVVPLEGDICAPEVVQAAKQHAIDTVLFINVLEHIKEDQQALAHAAAILAPAGRVIIFVPAHRRLFGTLDALVGHYRRYDRSELAAKVAQAGFTVEKLFYFNSVGAIGRFFIGRVFRQDQTGEGQVSFFDRLVVPILSRVEALWKPPFGQSLVCVGRKEG